MEKEKKDCSKVKNHEAVTNSLKFLKTKLQLLPVPGTDFRTFVLLLCSNFSLLDPDPGRKPTCIHPDPDPQHGSSPYFGLRRNVGYDSRPDVLSGLDIVSFVAELPTANSATAADATYDLIRLVGVLRAADMFWNAEMEPVLCLMEGETLADFGPRIVVRQHSG